MCECMRQERASYLVAQSLFYPNASSVVAGNVVAFVYLASPSSHPSIHPSIRPPIHPSIHPSGKSFNTRTFFFPRSTSVPYRRISQVRVMVQAHTRAGCSTYRDHECAPLLEHLRCNGELCSADEAFVSVNHQQGGVGVPHCRHCGLERLSLDVCLPAHTYIHTTPAAPAQREFIDSSTTVDWTSENAKKRTTDRPTTATDSRSIECRFDRGAFTQRERAVRGPLPAA